MTLEIPELRNELLVMSAEDLRVGEIGGAHAISQTLVHQPLSGVSMFTK